MARRICQALLAVALLYAGAVAAFAFLAYRGPRPSVLEVARDFHLFVVGRGTPPKPPEEPGGMPAPAAVPAAGRSAEPPEPPPVPPTPPDSPDPAAAGAPDAGAAVASEKASADPRFAAIFRVRHVLLPRAEEKLAGLKAAGPDLLDRKADARAVLVSARDLIGPLLDRNRDDAEAQSLYQRVMDLLAALDKR